MPDRYVILITNAEFKTFYNKEIGETGMLYNPVLDKYDNWTISKEEVEMSTEPFLYVKSRTLVLFQAPIESSWF